MGAVLTIDSKEAIRLAEELAYLTGDRVPDAVTRALAQQVAQERRRHAADELARELGEIGRRCAAHLNRPFQSADLAELYGEDGMPA